MTKFKVGDRVQTIDGCFSFDPIGAVVEEIFADGIRVMIDECPGRADTADRSGWFYYFEEVEEPQANQSDISPEDADTSERDDLAKQILLEAIEKVSGVAPENAPRVISNIFDLADAYMAEKARRKV